LQYSNSIGPQSLGGGGVVVLDGVVTTDVVIGSGVVRAMLLSETNKAAVSMVATLCMRTMK
jgi:hypothetical protein